MNNVPEFCRDRRFVQCPLVLDDGRWNLALQDVWLANGEVQPGPQSGRSPMRWGHATYGDSIALFTVVVANSQRQLAELDDHILEGIELGVPPDLLQPNFVARRELLEATNHLKSLIANSSAGDGAPASHQSAAE